MKYLIGMIMLLLFLTSCFGGFEPTYDTEYVPNPQDKCRLAREHNDIEGPFINPNRCYDRLGLHFIGDRCVNDSTGYEGEFECDQKTDLCKGKEVIRECPSHQACFQRHFRDYDNMECNPRRD